MSFLTPVALALGAIAGPIILLYMLRLRRREVQVSSTLLWQQLLRDREANAPWQRLRRNLLLLLQLLILAALVIALARPFVEVPTVTTGRIALLIDASARITCQHVRTSPLGPIATPVAIGIFADHGPVVQPAHLPDPILCLGLLKYPVQGRDQLCQEPAVLDGQESLIDVFEDILVGDNSDHTAHGVSIIAAFFIQRKCHSTGRRGRAVPTIL